MAVKRSPAMEELHQLAWKRQKDLHPTVPVHAVPFPKFADKTANALTKSIIEYITCKGGFATRQQSQGQFRQEKIQTRVGVLTKGSWTKSTVRNGVSDINAVYAGKSLQIEIKVGNDRMSEAQLQVKSEVERAGGIFYVARSFDSFYEWFNKTFRTNGIQG